MGRSDCPLWLARRKSSVEAPTGSVRPREQPPMDGSAQVQRVSPRPPWVKPTSFCNPIAQPPRNHPKITAPGSAAVSHLKHDRAPPNTINFQPAHTYRAPPDNNIFGGTLGRSKVLQYLAFTVRGNGVSAANKSRFITGSARESQGG